MSTNPIYVVAEPLRHAHRTLVRFAHRFLRASHLGFLGILTLTVPHVAFASAPRTFLDLANLLVTITDSAAGVLIIAGLVVYLYGVSTNILKMGEESGEKLKAYFFWGIIVLFVMTSIWGILALLQNTLFAGDPYSPNSGTPAAPVNSFTPPTTLE